MIEELQEGVPLWCVYGPDCFPTVFCCRISSASGPKAIWGYGVYRRAGGFRTLGRDLKGWLAEHPEAKFFADSQQAMDHLQKLVTPRIK